MTERLLVVAGPTASGKSDLGIALAKRLNGAIINVDSVQVYRGFDIGSAKVAPADRSLVPHYLIDALSPAERCDAGWFAVQSAALLASLALAGTKPIVVSGTNLYLKAILNGLAELPRGDSAVRTLIDSLSDEELYQRVQAIDPERSNGIHPHDRLRLGRALEVFLLTGQTQSTLWETHQWRQRRPATIVVPTWPRAELYRRIDRRAQALVEGGLLEETEEILKQYGSEVAGLRTIGYAQAVSVLRGEAPRSGLAESVAQATRRFAKQQLTFWRNEPLRRGWRVLPAQVGLSHSEGVAVAVGGRRGQKGEGKEILPLQCSSLDELLELVGAEDVLASEDGSVSPVSVLYISAPNLLGGLGR